MPPAQGLPQIQRYDSAPEPHLGEAPSPHASREVQQGKLSAFRHCRCYPQSAVQSDQTRQNTWNQPMIHIGQRATASESLPQLWRPTAHTGGTWYQARARYRRR